MTIWRKSENEVKRDTQLRNAVPEMLNCIARTGRHIRRNEPKDKGIHSVHRS